MNIIKRIIGITLTYFFLTGCILFAMQWKQNLYVFVGALTIILTLSIAYILSLIFVQKREIEDLKNERMNLHENFRTKDEDKDKDKTKQNKTKQ